MSEPRETLRAGASGEAEHLVVVVRPGGEKDITMITEFGEVRFIEGRALLPLSLARELARRPGWCVEP